MYIQGTGKLQEFKEWMPLDLHFEKSLPESFADCMHAIQLVLHAPDENIEPDLLESALQVVNSKGCALANVLTMYPVGKAMIKTADARKDVVRDWLARRGQLKEALEQKGANPLTVLENANALCEELEVDAGQAVSVTAAIHAGLEEVTKSWLGIFDSKLLSGETQDLAKSGVTAKLKACSDAVKRMQTCTAVHKLISPTEAEATTAQLNQMQILMQHLPMLIQVKTQKELTVEDAQALREVLPACAGILPAIDLAGGGISKFFQHFTGPAIAQKLFTVHSEKLNTLLTKLTSLLPTCVREWSEGSDLLSDCNASVMEFGIHQQFLETQVDAYKLAKAGEDSKTMAQLSFIAILANLSPPLIRLFKATKKEFPMDEINQARGGGCV